MNHRIKKKRMKAANRYKDIDLVFNNVSIYQKLKICRKFFIDLNTALESRLNISYDEKLRMRRCDRHGAGNVVRRGMIYAVAYPEEDVS